MISQQRLPLFILLLGVCLAPINLTIMTVGLTRLQRIYDTPLSTTMWIIIAYVIALVVTKFVGTKIGALYGYKHVLLASLLLTCIASIVCMMSTTFRMLLIGRFLQAIGTTLVTLNSIALLPKVNVKNSVSLLAAAIAPLIGVILINIWDVKALFWLNIPIVMILFAGAWVLPSVPRQKTTLDLLSAGYVAIMLTAVACIFTAKTAHPFMLWVAFGVALLLLVIRGVKHEAPLIHIELFHIKSFRSAAVLMLLHHVIVYGLLWMLPIGLEKENGYSLTVISVMLTAYLFGHIVAYPIGKVLDRKLGTFKSAMAAVICMLVALDIIILIIPKSEHPSIGAIGLFVVGIGLGLMLPIANKVSTRDVPAHQLQSAQVTYTAFRYIGVIVAAIIVALGLDLQHSIMTIMTFVVILPVFVKSFLIRK